MTSPTLKREDDRKEPKPGERIVMVLSAAFTLALLGHMVWQVVALPGVVDPAAEVVSVTTGPGGEAIVRVALVNAGSEGLIEAEVEVACGEPPPSLTFTNVPAHGRREGVVTCPAGTQDPEVSVGAWMPT